MSCSPPDWITAPVAQRNMMPSNMLLHLGLEEHCLLFPSRQRHILQATLITANNVFHSYLNPSLEEFFGAQAMNHIQSQQFKFRQPRFRFA